ncbi:TetR/AcrR family transcriptional regulator [Undibacterium sp. TS12]|uniref:TetR/AcrR family transcriptional regulator n=1 Tax=Undibacterium sp. TS12 TaxID=2908202 RepID=UPI001F4C86A1|nr:TetR/AcrR family transcriptional regulator [Undibacterium sp. TS12]MCH8619270.1 TetR/AcrR family transcriptional regulator [Undibacterium sp. TS12]
MPAAILSREEVVSRILQEFRSHGYDGTSLARLSQATGLGRSSLYHYFPNGKEDMASAAMAAVGEIFVNDVLAALNSPGDPRQRFMAFAAQLSVFYHAGNTSCLTDVFSMGGAAALFQQYLSLRVANLMRHIAAVVAEAGFDQAESMRRAENAIISIQGSLVVSRALGDNAPFLRTMREMPDALLIA